MTSTPPIGSALARTSLQGLTLGLLLGLAGSALAPGGAAGENSGMQELEEQLRIRGLEAYLFTVGTRSLHISISAGSNLDAVARSGLCDAVTQLAIDLVPERSVTIELHLSESRRAAKRYSCPRSGSARPDGVGTS